MASVELIAVGTELLLGQLVDTNTAFIAQRLAEAGIDVRTTHCVGDNLKRIASAIRASLDRAEGVITTGGLGPTVDDLTKEAVCEALGLDTELYEPALRQMESLFASIGRPMQPNNRKQAELPRGSRPLPNPNGTAPGFIAFGDSKFVACLPGVPREMKPMLVDVVVPFVRERFEARDAIYTRVLHTIGVGESEIDHRIGDLFRSSENPKIAVLAHDFRADVKIMAKADSASKADEIIAPLQEEIERRLDGYVFGHDDATPASAVLRLLETRSQTIALAESFTGGRIAAALTSVPGSSRSFIGGLIAYDNAVKVQELSVEARAIEAQGAVSEEVVRQMARGARARFGAGIALASTGIAGPQGGSQAKPVGLGWLAISAATDERVRRVQLAGDRATVLQRATTIALGFLWHYLTEPSTQ